MEIKVVRSVDKEDFEKEVNRLMGKGWTYVSLQAVPYEGDWPMLVAFLTKTEEIKKS